MHPWINYQTQQWRYILEITRAIAARLDLESVLDKALRYAVDLIGGEAGLVALRDASGAFRFAARYGIEPRIVARLDSLLTDIPLAFERDPAALRRLPELGIRFSGLLDDELIRLENAMVLPLVASEHLLGMIYVFRRRGEVPFNALDRDALAGFADHVAIAIENARLYNDAEARARELLAVIEGSSQGVLIAGPDGSVRRINRALERLTGWTRSQAVGQDYRQVVPLTDERGRTVDPPTFDPAARQGSSAEGFLVRPGGARGAFVHLSLSPLIGDSNQVSSLLLNVVDITELRESDESKTAFLAGISHDLKTPLALIRGYAETLRRTDVAWDSATRDDSLAVIQDEAEYLTNLVNAMLDAAQLEHSRLALKKRPTQLDELAGKIVERFQVTQPGRRWALELGDLPPVPADTERVREVLQNLIGNAVKYSPPGSTITVGGWSEPERVGIFVRDQGPGIPVEEQARIFNRFTRGRSYKAQRTEGAGLGLFLSRAIVEQHGGRIWMENLPEGGAAFYFTLPRGSGD